MTLILCERDGPVALLTLNRPDVLNALSTALEEELAVALASAQVREASALIIRGAGERAFSAGADTTELDVATPETALAYYEYTGPDGDYETRMKTLAEAPRMREWWDIMEPMQVPLEGRAPGAWWADMEEVFHVD